MCNHVGLGPGKELVRLVKIMKFQPATFHGYALPNIRIYNEHIDK